MIRTQLILLALLSLLATLPLHAEARLEPLSLGHEPPIGDAMRLGTLLNDDADSLRRAHPESCSLFEDSLDALQKGDLILAAAQTRQFLARATAASDKARGQVRLAWIHALAGSIFLANEYASNTPALPELKGELHLVRAHILWQEGRFDLATKEIVLAGSSEPAAPAWALELWKRQHDPKAQAVTEFASLQAPPRPGSPEQLSYAEKALKLGAYQVADRIIGVSIPVLLQGRMTGEEGAEAGLLHCRRLQRTLLTTLLSPQLRPEAGQSWDYLCAITHAATENGGDRTDWDLFLGALIEGRRTVSGFDLGNYNLVDDVAKAGKAGASGILLDALTPALSQPRVRYGSFLVGVLDAYDAMPQPQSVHITDKPDLSADDLADFEKTLSFLEEQEKTATRLRAQLPVDSPEIGPETRYREILARVRFMDALMREDHGAAKTQMAILEAVAKRRDVGDIEACRDAMAALDERDFPAEVVALAALPTEKLPSDRISELLLRAHTYEASLQRAHGREVMDLPTLNGSDLELQRSIVLLRLLSACSADSVGQAEHLLSRLQSLCTPGHLPGFDQLPGCVQRVAALPFSLKAVQDPEVLGLIEDLEGPDVSDSVLEDLDEDIGRLGEGLHIDGLRLGMIQAIHRLRLGEEWTARDLLARLRAETPVNLAARAELDRIENLYTPARVMARAIRACVSARPGEREDRFLILSRLARRHYAALLEKFGAEALADPSRLPPAERATLLQAGLGLVLDAAGHGRLLEGLRWALPLGIDSEVGRQAREALAKAPFTLDLPDDDARQLWKDIPVLERLDQDKLGMHLATISRLRDSSVFIRMAEFLWAYKQADYDKAARVLDGLTPLFASAPKTQAATVLMGLMLRRARDARAATLSRMEQTNLERLKYVKEYNATVRRLNSGTGAGIRRDGEPASQALGIREAEEGGLLSTQEALPQVECLQALGSAGEENEHAKSERQRSLDSLAEDRTRIAEYDRELRTLAEDYNEALSRQVPELQDRLTRLATDG